MKLSVQFLRGMLAVVFGAWPAVSAIAADPAANFQIDPRQTEAGLPVTFKNTSNGGVPPLRFLWTFHDGESSDVSPVRVYQTPGTFEVKLVVTDYVGVKDEKTDSITVDGPTLLAALLPVSRSVLVGSTATAFATVINAGHVTATGVKIQLDNKTGPGGTKLPANFTFQTTDPATNMLIGLPDAPVNLLPGQSQSFLISVTPSEPLTPLDVRFDIDGTNTTRDARTVIGLNTLLLSASTQATPDIVALAVTPDANGILTLAGSPGVGAFSVAAVNVGADGMMIASADTGTASLPINLFVCQTKPTTGECESPPASVVGTQINQSATPTFAVFVNASASVPYDPEVNRIFVRFRDAGGVTRGATSVAVKGP